jgi:hypothetical protein
MSLLLPQQRTAQIAQGFAQSQLEASLAAVHQLHLHVTKLTSKYRSSLAADDAGRAQLAADRRVATQARLEGKV